MRRHHLQSSLHMYIFIYMIHLCIISFSINMYIYMHEYMCVYELHTYVAQCIYVACEFSLSFN